MKKISTRNISKKLCEDFFCYKRIKGFSKKMASRVVRRKLNNEAKFDVL